MRSFQGRFRHCGSSREATSRREPVSWGEGKNVDGGAM
jgi:hypothetical protein